MARILRASVSRGSAPVLRNAQAGEMPQRPAQLAAHGQAGGRAAFAERAVHDHMRVVAFFRPRLQLVGKAWSAVWTAAP